MNYKRFEVLPCWQVARELCKVVFELINNSKIKNVVNKLKVLESI